jgi:hypothetical protein
VWFTAALIRAKKLPAFERFTAAPPAALIRQTAEEQQFVMQQLSARLGIPLVRVPWRPPNGDEG